MASHAIDTAPIQHFTSSTEPRSLSRLVLSHYRNYRWLEMAFEPSSVVLVGANGAGKTNLMEAISLLAPGRGLRGASLAEFQQFSGGEDVAPMMDGAWSVAAEMQTRYGEVMLGTARDMQSEQEKRVVKIDGAIARSQQQLAAQLGVVWFTPPMAQLFAESAGERRRYWDRIVGYFAPDHSSNLHRYDHAMRERNQLMQKGMMDPHWIGAIERKMAELSAMIAAARHETVVRINAMLAQTTEPFPKAVLAMQGAVEEWWQQQPDPNAMAAEEYVVEMLAKNRAKDAAAGRTLHGVHKSDLMCWFSAKKLPAGLCSTGEQKALMLSLTMAVVRAKSAWSGVTPLLLLDEVVAHLDAGRREALFAAIAALGVQAWMTGTDADSFAALGAHAQRFEVVASESGSSLRRM